MKSIVAHRNSECTTFISVRGACSIEGSSCDIARGKGLAIIVAYRLPAPADLFTSLLKGRPALCGLGGQLLRPTASYCGVNADYTNQCSMNRQTLISPYHRINQRYTETRALNPLWSLYYRRESRIPYSASKSSIYPPAKGSSFDMKTGACAASTDHHSSHLDTSSPTQKTACTSE